MTTKLAWCIVIIFGGETVSNSDSELPRRGGSPWNLEGVEMQEKKAFKLVAWL
jgi:hypothetical protein